jgi:hypothetical protein
MPVVAALGLETMIRRVRHAALEQLGVVEGPLPRFRPIRWAVDVRGTWQAWTYGVREGISDPRRAIALSRRSPELVDAGVPDPSEVAARALELQDMTKSAAVRAAFEHLGDVNVPRALAYLREHGLVVADNTAYSVARKVRDERPQLAAVPAAEALP